MSIELSSQDGSKLVKLFTALSKAQSAINNVLADKDAHKHKYAELSQVLAVIKKPFADNGLVIIQSPFSEKIDNVTTDYLSTMIAHESGEWIRSSMILPSESGNKSMSVIQAMGSHITYARRYMATAMIGIAQVDNEEDLVPNATLDLEKKGVDLEKLRIEGIDEAKQGRDKLDIWYRKQSTSIKKYLSNEGKDFMADIASYIPR